MKKLNCLLMVVLLFSNVAAWAQDEATAPVETPKYWKCNGILTLNASATGMWNWAAGGNNNATGIAAANITLLYAKDGLAWESNLDTEIGMTYLDATDYHPLRKSNDKINFNTKFGWEFHKQLFLTAQAGFKSQYAKGYNYGDDYMTPVSSWLSPSYTDISVGIDYKPNDIFSLYVSPVAGKISTCTKDSLANFGSLTGTMNALRPIYGIDADKKFRAELGFSAKFGINYCRVENLKIISTVSVFTPLVSSNGYCSRYALDNNKERIMDANGEYVLNERCFGNFDVDWDTSISYQFLKVLNVSLTTQLKYYPGVKIANAEGISAERVQFKGVIGLGIGYSF